MIETYELACRTKDNHKREQEIQAFQNSDEKNQAAKRCQDKISQMPKMFKEWLS